jgi:hypothetical protein
MSVAAPRVAGAQTVPTTASVQCAPGIPSCTSLRFFFTTVGQISLDNLFLSLLGGPFTFAQPFGPGNPGLYSAQDLYGPFGGSTTINSSATALFIDFIGENGFAFELDAGGTGFIDVDADNPTGATASNLAFAYSGTGTSNGMAADITGVTATPEPATLTLVATGFAAAAAARRRRRKEALASSDVVQ